MRRFVEKARDPISSITHLFGAVLSVIGTVIMVIKGRIVDDLPLISMVSVIIFGLSMIILYLSSGIYHYISGPNDLIMRMRKLDHSAIYLLIAGSYTPIFLNVFSVDKGIPLTIIIWLIAFSGIIIKLFWMDAPRRLYTSAYVLMGWFILVDIKSFLTLPTIAIVLTVAGGIFYTVGAVLYALKKPNFSKKFGFHEVFHIFIMLGTLMHFIMVFSYIA